MVLATFGYFSDRQKGRDFFFFFVGGVGNSLWSMGVFFWGGGLVLAHGALCATWCKEAYVSK